MVISIIALLLGLLLPAILWAQKRAYITATQADMQALGVGLDQYHADFGMYPNSSIVASAAAYGGAIPAHAGYQVMAEALLGFLPGSPAGTGDGAGSPSSSPPPTLAETKGFTMYPSKKVYGPYMSVTASNIYMVPGTSATIPPEYYFVDAFGQAASTNSTLFPILYFSANTNPAGTGATSTTAATIFGNNSAGIFNVADDNTSIVTSAEFGAVPTAGFLNLIGDPSQSTTVVSGNNILGSNGYLLVSAGPDGKYWGIDPNPNTHIDYGPDDIVYGQ